MTEENTVSWNEAISDGGFISLETDEQKVLVLTNWRLEEAEKFGTKQVEFVADVVEEDGQPVTDKKFTTTSNRLKKKLRTIFENKEPTGKVKISLLKVGEKYDTQYSCKELTE